ncbi:RNA polymerase sigma-70 factor (ECF subfamily) [Pedobacter sp. CAN_A7]|uniref:RNA polymerase sigma-70 factor n=1 Tax=Pedobacter sp. CAN_A7 TaxID=2787722 RepID=UPI0018CB5F99
MQFQKCSDAQLWEAIKDDNTKAFDTLFDRYWSAIHSTAFSYLKDADASSEIVHDIFLKLWQNRKEFEIHSFRNYLCTAARYHVYKYLKAKKSNALVYIADYTAHNQQQSKNEGADALISQDLEEVVDRSLTQLPKRCREIFILSRKKHLSNEEIAIAFGISKRTVENQLTAALHFLRPILKYTTVMTFMFFQLLNNHHIGINKLGGTAQSTWHSGNKTLNFTSF